jgi:hypothetical protein
MGVVLRGPLEDLQAVAKEIEQILISSNIRTVYRTLFPGRLWIRREPVTEITNENEGDDGDQT